MSRGRRRTFERSELPVEALRAGGYSDTYFRRARDVLLRDGHQPHATMQVFGKADAFLGGIDEALAILEHNRPYAHSRQLAQSDRDLLLCRAAEGSHTERLPVP